MRQAMVAFVVLALAASACAPAAVQRTRPKPPVASRSDAPPVEVARARPPAPPAPAPPAAVRADDGPLTAKIDATTPAGRSAALRLTEDARRRLAAGDAPRAIELLERAITVDARVPYAYYFLAKAHAELDHGALAHRFLDRAEQKLANEPYWRSEVYALRGQLQAREGNAEAAEASYRRALAAWPGNRAAAEALTATSGRGKESP